MTPVTVLGGYLGAGKTTLLNGLLRDARGMLLAVLVNDFGAVNIDADLVESRDGDVLNLAGGCVCCSFGSDLVSALIALPQRSPAPEHVLIETSGVALPASVARTVGLTGGALSLDAIVVVADAETVRQRAADRYVGETVRMQLGQADLIVVSKRDLVGPDEAASLNDWLAQHAPRARILYADHGRLPAPIILGARLSWGGPRPGGRGLFDERPGGEPERRLLLPPAGHAAGLAGR